MELRTTAPAQCVLYVVKVCLLSAAAAKSLQSCRTLWDPTDGSPPGSAIPGILQARTLEWVAISFFNAWKWKVKVKSLSRVWLLATPWTAAYQALPSMGFSRQEYWSWLPLPSPAVSSLRCLNKSSQVQGSFSRVRPPHIPPQPRPLHSRGRETQEEQLPFLPLPRTHYPLRATRINLSGLGQPKPFMMAFSVPSEVKWERMKTKKWFSSWSDLNNRVQKHAWGGFFHSTRVLY